jgi:UDP-N-acetylmuramate--alanine ligase
MHIYFSGIGGVGIGPLALIARQAGYDVSGSDIKESQYLNYLRDNGITDIHVGQTAEQIAEIHKQKPIDWFVYSSALRADHPELRFCRENDIKTSKRDELLNEILSQKHLRLVAVAGTHGKTTTTAMLVWLFKQLGVPISYSVGAKISFGEMGSYQEGSEYFIYEADEFDRNFLAFHPFFSLISGVSYDHHEIYPTQEDYNRAFLDFLAQSQRAILWHDDADRLGAQESDEKFAVESYDDPGIENLKLAGLYNRRDAWLVIKAVSQITGARVEDLFEPMNRFPGVSRRFEKIAENLYSDDAHTPDKIRGVMSVAAETARKNDGQEIVVVYEPLTNRRMHYLAKDHHSVFDGASAIYWVPSYLAREDPGMRILPPAELIQHLSEDTHKIAHEAQLNEELKHSIQHHLSQNHLVVGMSGGGGGSLDEWLRENFLQS